MPNAPDSPSAPEKDPRPGPLFEGNPGLMGTKDRHFRPWTDRQLTSGDSGPGWGERGADAAGPPATRSQGQHLCSLSLLTAQALTWAQQRQQTRDRLRMWVTPLG